MQISVRRASPADVPLVEEVLREAASWLEKRGVPLWLPSELGRSDIEAHVTDGLYFLAEVNGECAGTFRFQLTDPEFWPDVPPHESVFVHRLAVRRQYSGGQVSSAMLTWAAERGRQLGRSYLRLDCEARRPRLRAVYEAFGFRHHSDRQVGPFFVSRYELPLEMPPESPGAA
jgi:GNAT superfamily N-acetyltransferase